MEEAGCVHLAFLDGEEQEEVFRKIQELESSSDHALAACASAEHFQKFGRPCGERELTIC
jgi:hypothetical protein